MWARLTQLVQTHAFTCRCVLVIVLIYDTTVLYGLDELVDEAADSDEDGGGEGASVYDDNEKRVGNTSCGMCSAMPTAAECLCCQEVDELAWKLQDLLCITQQQNFTAVCLNEDVLRTALVSMIDLRRDSITEPLTCRLLTTSKQTCVDASRFRGGKASSFVRSWSQSDSAGAFISLE